MRAPESERSRNVTCPQHFPLLPSPPTIRLRIRAPGSTSQSVARRGFLRDPRTCFGVREVMKSRAAQTTGFFLAPAPSRTPLTIEMM
jgi:hypothetical protein